MCRLHSLTTKYTAGVRSKDAGPGWFIVLALAGVAVVVTALAASGGDLGAELSVRGGGAPAILILMIGVAMLLGGVAGWFWRRKQ